MPKVSELSKSNYIGQDDIKDRGGSLDLTITDVQEEEVTSDGGGKDSKWTLSFREHQKHWIVNATNGQIISEFLGSDEMFDWKGQRIQLFIDPSVMFAGKRTGGVRARAPMNGQASSTMPVALDGAGRKEALMRAWKAFHAKHPGVNADSIAVQWKMALKDYFGEKPRELILAVQWDKFVADGFVPAENPIPDEGGVPVDDIPF